MNSFHTGSSGSFIDFAALKAALSITRVLEHYGLLPALEPLRGGNPLDFTALMEGVDVREAALRLSQWFGSGFDERPLLPAPRPAACSMTERRAENPPLGFELRSLERDHPYLRERGIGARTARVFGLGLCRRGTMAGRIVIPVHNASGRLVAYAGRWPGIPPRERLRYKLPQGFRKSLEVFNLHRAVREDGRLPLIVTEGFFDVIHLWRCGFRTVVALMGSALSPAQRELLIRAAENRPGLILLFDGDGAGRAGQEKALPLLAEHAFVRAVKLPGEGSQPDRFTRDELQTLLCLP